MKSITFLTLSFLFATLGLNAQWGGKTIKGNGNYTTVTRNVGEYEGITMSGWFDVEIVSGKEGKITIEGESNLLEHLLTENKKGDLLIRTEKGYQLKPSSYKRGIKITVPVEEISAVTLSGSGDIIGKTTITSGNFASTLSGSGDIRLSVDATNVSTTLSGSGDIVMAGKAQNFSATVSGSGDIKAFDLESVNAKAVIAGSADIRLTVTGSLQARVSGSGDIRYRGNPSSVDSKVAGSGDVEAE